MSKTHFSDEEEDFERIRDVSYDIAEKAVELYRLANMPLSWCIQRTAYNILTNNKGEKK